MSRPRGTRGRFVSKASLHDDASGAGQRMCSMCGTTETTQWRSGPNGESLCNADGIRAARANRLRARQSKQHTQPCLDYGASRAQMSTYPYGSQYQGTAPLPSSSSLLTQSYSSNAMHSPVSSGNMYTGATSLSHQSQWTPYNDGHDYTGRTRSSGAVEQYTTPRTLPQPTTTRKIQGGAHWHTPRSSLVAHLTKPSALTRGTSWPKQPTASERTDRRSRTEPSVWAEPSEWTRDAADVLPESAGAAGPSFANLSRYALRLGPRQTTAFKPEQEGPRREPLLTRGRDTLKRSTSIASILAGAEAGAPGPKDKAHVGARAESPGSILPGPMRGKDGELGARVASQAFLLRERISSTIDADLARSHGGLAQASSPARQTGACGREQQVEDGVWGASGLSPLRLSSPVSATLHAQGSDDGSGGGAAGLSPVRGPWSVPSSPVSSSQHHRSCHNVCSLRNLLN